MFRRINHGKFLLLGISLFGVFTVNVLHSIVYQNILLAPFTNQLTQQKQFFQSQIGFVLIEKTLMWIFAQISCLVLLKRQQKRAIPLKYSFSCGIFVFLSSLFFTTGIFQISFRLCLSDRSSTYLIATLLGFFLSSYLTPSKSPKLRDTLAGAGIGISAIIFWTYGSEQWTYNPLRGGVIYNFLIIMSGFCDSLLSVLQSKICQKFQPDYLTLLLKVSRSAVICSFICALITEDFAQIYKYLRYHPCWTLAIFIHSSMYFLVQIFIYRIIAKMTQNVPPFILTSKQTLTVHQSSAFSIYKFTIFQFVGIALFWISVTAQFFWFVKKENQQEKLLKKIPEQEPQIGLLPIRINQSLIWSQRLLKKDIE